jgi:uncharacterized LabA/DUF88 family protein
MIKDFLIYLLTRDSMRASVVAINVGQDMSANHLRQIADYYSGLADNREYKDSISANYQ